MSRPYSVSMLRRTGLTDPTEATVPNNKRWVVTDADVYWGGGVSLPSTQLGIAGQLTWWIAQVDPNEAQVLSGDTWQSRSWQWRGRQVLYAGEAIMVSSNGVAIDVAVSGYELDELPPA